MRVAAGGALVSLWLVRSHLRISHHAERLRNRSSAVMVRRADFIGVRLPVSHHDTAPRVTPITCANCSWLSPSLWRNSAILSGVHVFMLPAYRIHNLYAITVDRCIQQA